MIPIGAIEGMAKKEQPPESSLSKNLGRYGAVAAGSKTPTHAAIGAAPSHFNDEVPIAPMPRPIGLGEDEEHRPIGY
jgi:hypothetical protein